VPRGRHALRVWKASLAASPLRPRATLKGLKSQASPFRRKAIELMRSAGPLTRIQREMLAATNDHPVSDSA
jgi:hypothetical protein